ncbi:MAG TPA: hypothetical protein VGV39_13080 [Mesorhizobium sp.]|uniref:hypothetical protein n=1 Tax=Mesorhizobium sp. TaxID=1871066 RepID=UPI002DDD04F2|nr:hypothetical protein [Mesorhizobium sp.]HEV2504003.1 hypothetical protein [Mesorhizobium sp.]
MFALTFSGFSWRNFAILRACFLYSCILLATGLAHAEEVWADLASGTTNVSGVGTVRYTIGYSSIGYDHFRSEITATWHDGGDRTQTIYDGIYDKPPAKVWGMQNRLCVSMAACTRYEDACTTQTIAYRYDVATKSFAETGDHGCQR